MSFPSPPNDKVPRDRSHDCRICLVVWEWSCGLVLLSGVRRGVTAALDALKNANAFTESVGRHEEFWRVCIVAAVIIDVRVFVDVSNVRWERCALRCRCHRGCYR